MTADSHVSRRSGTSDEHDHDPLLIAARRWLDGTEAKSHFSFRTTNLRAEWDAGLGVLILDVALLDQPAQVFVGGWERGIGWALNRNGTAEMMPTDWDPGLQMLSPENEWARTWRQQIPEPVLAELRNFPADYWFMLCCAGPAAVATRWICYSANPSCCGCCYGLHVSSSGRHPGSVSVCI